MILSDISIRRPVLATVVNLIIVATLFFTVSRRQAAIAAAD